CELRCVVDRDKQPAVFHKLLQVLQTIPAKSWSHVVSLVDAAEIWRELSLLPGKRISVHRQAVDNLLCPTTDRRKQNHVVLALEIRFTRHVLRADVSERNLRLIEPDAIPALILRAQPRVHHRDPRRSDWMRFN